MPTTRSTTLISTLAACCLLALPAQAYEEMTVSDGGTVAGKITFTGSVPTRKIVTTKDQAVCGGIREEGKIAVGPDKGAKDVVVQLVGIEKGKAWGDGGEMKKPVLDNEACRFVPHVQVIKAGEIDIVNSDPVLHNTHGYYGKRTAFNVALPNQGQSIAADLGRPGVVRVDCDAHGWMEGWIIVSDSPYYAVTTEDGSFTIEGVPPGDYTLSITHELTGTKEMAVSVKAGETADGSLDLSK